MRLVSYLAHDDTNIDTVRQRLSLAQPPVGLVIVNSLPELLSCTQSLPIRAILLDISWPRSCWQQLREDLSRLKCNLPILAIANTTDTGDWWHYADDLLSLDDSIDLFYFRLNQTVSDIDSQMLEKGSDLSKKTFIPALGEKRPAIIFPETSSMLESSQFRQFADIFSGMEEPELLEAFIGWVQSTCQTSRAVLLLNDAVSGSFTCRAYRGLPSALVPHCNFPQTSAICRWLSLTGRILLRDSDDNISLEIINELDMLQAVAAIPVMNDGQLIGILGLGPRLVGQYYSAVELEGLFTIAGQMAVALYHRRNHWSVKQQKELTEQMLGVMPTGTIVLGADHCISFVNAAAAMMINKPQSAIIGADLRVLPSPLGDLAYESLLRKVDVPRRELNLASNNNRPIAVTACLLATSPPSAMLLLEDRAVEKVLVEERERRVDLEVITNLVHHIAHELRNPLVTLATFSSLVTTHAQDADFQDYCETVLQPEISRVNLIIEQLLVLTNHAEYQFTEIDIMALIERFTDNADMKNCLVTAMPLTLPHVYGDAHRLETAIACLVRTVLRFNDSSTPATMRIELKDANLLLNFEIPTNIQISSEHLLNPWQQLLGDNEAEVDFGVATACYIFEQHQGTLAVNSNEKLLILSGRLPLNAAETVGRKDKHESAKGSDRR